MNYKEAFDKIKELLTFGEQQPTAVVVAEPVSDTAPVAEPESVQESEPVALNADPQNAQPDFSAQIKVLQEEIEALKKAHSSFQSQLEEEVGKVKNVAEAQKQTIALVEQIAAEPTDEPAQTPKNSFKKQPDTDRQARLVAGFTNASNNKK